MDRLVEFRAIASAAAVSPDPSPAPSSSSPTTTTPTSAADSTKINTGTPRTPTPFTASARAIAKSADDFLSFLHSQRRAYLDLTRYVSATASTMTPLQRDELEMATAAFASKCAGRIGALQTGVDDAAAAARTVRVAATPAPSFLALLGDSAADAAAAAAEEEEATGAADEAAKTDGVTDELRHHGAVIVALHMSMARVTSCLEALRTVRAQQRADATARRAPAAFRVGGDDDAGGDVHRDADQQARGSKRNSDTGGGDAAGLRRRLMSSSAASSSTSSSAAAQQKRWRGYEGDAADIMGDDASRNDNYNDGSGGDDFASDEALQAQLQAENDAFLRAMRTQIDQLRQSERKMAEISQLMTLFSTKVVEQQATIESIHGNAVNATANVRLGNESLRSAAAHGVSFRVNTLLLLLVASFSLLFLDWDN
jgi:syntaxin 18